MSHYPLFETLSIIDGKFQNLSFHQERMDNAFNAYLNEKPGINLSDIVIPNEYQQGQFRCRIDYNAYQYEMQIYPYTPRKIQQFQCVYVENFDYSFKFTDRKRLDSLKNLQKTNQEILIINNDKVSDCTIGNLLFLKNGRWYSPTDYLLKGTQLAYLLEQSVVELVSINTKDLLEYEAVMMINALNPFDPKRAIIINKQSIIL
ncbi:aminotransferase class IV family protein [Otariodibacter oris]|uniref:4-amino-4-deoxychorismate lyase n=1 Tax=Otariodibacter oris TaxID=1032623 RepID=A0A420XEL0_9PAST|nr:aminotransferase class IV family protein [Otariodibacter oris]QGM80195.1 branched-chain amino acid aminotransferase [Otariodibacter oris]RKR70616.1 4-amino-4-deoxychorismate lyase [Otariodibacter oris]